MFLRLWWAVTKAVVAVQSRSDPEVSYLSVTRPFQGLKDRMIEQLPGG